MKYNVSIFAIVRVKVVDVEADNQKGAIEEAEKSIDLYSMFVRIGDDKVEYVEYADDIDGFVVDEVGDEEYAKSGHYDKHGELLSTEGRE